MNTGDTVKLSLWRMPWIPGHADAGGVCDDQLMDTMADKSVYNQSRSQPKQAYKPRPKKRPKLRKQGVTQELGDDVQAAFAAELGLPAAHAGEQAS